LLPAQKGSRLAKRIEVEYEGKRVPAEQLEFKSGPEPWAEYQFEDGTVLKVKAVLASVFRVIDQFKPDGEPVYGLMIGNLPVFSIPPELKRPQVRAEEATKGK
jgi:hypothetical protein